MNQWDKDNIQKILYGEGTNFTSILFRLIAKADRANQDRLYKGFPHETIFVSRYVGRSNASMEYLYQREYEFCNEYIPASDSNLSE